MIQAGDHRMPEEAEKNPVTSRMPTVAGRAAEATKMSTYLKAGVFSKRIAWSRRQCGDRACRPRREGGFSDPGLLQRRIEARKIAQQNQT